jgi:uncharacterized protein (DUF433 family)
LFDRITVEPGRMGGKPCIRGLRFTVAGLVRHVAAGRSIEQIQDDFPFIEPEDVRQALLYAARCTEVTVLSPEAAEDEWGEA